MLSELSWALIHALGTSNSGRAEATFCYPRFPPTPPGKPVLSNPDILDSLRTSVGLS